MKPRLYKINTFDLIAQDGGDGGADDSFDNQRAKTRDTFIHRSECDPRPSPYDVDVCLEPTLSTALLEEHEAYEPIVYFDDEIELVIEQPWRDSRTIRPS